MINYTYKVHLHFCLVCHLHWITLSIRKVSIVLANLCSIIVVIMSKMWSDVALFWFNHLLDINKRRNKKFVNNLVIEKV